MTKKNNIIKNMITFDMENCLYFIHNLWFVTQERPIIIATNIKKCQGHNSRRNVLLQNSLQHYLQKLHLSKNICAVEHHCYKVKAPVTQCPVSSAHSLILLHFCKQRRDNVFVMWHLLLFFDLDASGRMQRWCPSSSWRRCVWPSRSWQDMNDRNTRRLSGHITCSSSGTSREILYSSEAEEKR